MMSNKKVLLFGGSYNPIHQGHVNAAINAYNQLNVDEIWLIPRKYGYDGSLLLDGKHRINMINLAIKNLDYFKICNVELKDNNHNLIYTYNTGSLLVSKYPNYKFYFLIGADQLNALDTWYEVDKVTKLLQFVCYKRPGYPINRDMADRYNVILIDGQEIDISSTIIRNGTFNDINADVKQYIIDNKLYLEDRIKPLLPEERYIHVVSTAKLAKDVAKHYHLDANAAHIAAILHDIAKGKSKEEIYESIERYFPNKLKYPRYSYHAFASSYIASSYFAVTDRKILNAIDHHALANKRMSKLDKIVYIADKIEESRSFADKTAYLRELIYQDLDLCFIKTLQDQLLILKERNQTVNEDIYVLIDYYQRKYENGR